MKVLFAVSNEEISESIVKKYQKEYKQIISYKNVYYFNAILKELQKDKTYDRVVISEDLEAFTHTQYEQIDKFIFEKLDSISDEASNVKGDETPIILICTDRRTRPEQMLVKLFGIGVYNAIIGNDRSVDEVCRLINRPRTKKEAKTYYKIDTDDVNYQAETENDVSEMEIQNIVAHYKRLGKNEERYIESFDNIAAQYNDTQLRIISRFLPLNVRAVLEEKSSKYQQIMSFNNSVSDSLRKAKDERDEGPSEILLKSKNRENVFSEPVVIPSAVNTEGVKLARQKPSEQPPVETYTPPIVEIPGEEEQPTLQQEETEQPVAQSEMPTQAYDDFVSLGQDLNPVEETQQAQPEMQPEIQPELPQQQMFMQQMEVPEVAQESIQEVQPQPVKRGRGRPRKNPLPSPDAQPTVKRGRGRPRKNPLPEVQEQPQQQFSMLEETILPGLGEEPMQEQQPMQDTFLPGFQPEEPEKAVEDILSGLDTNSYQTEQQPEETYQPTYQPEPEQTYQPEPQPVQSAGFNTDFFAPNNRPDKVNQETNEEIDLSSLLTPDKKIVTFVGTSKNGTSFIVNNIAELLSSAGVRVAILDTTKNRNSYYIYTKNEENLREIATHSIEGLANGVARGIDVNPNLTVYTSLPEENDSIYHVDKILETLLQKHSLILIDTDFETPQGYFKQSQETYLVQSMDILTIQPLTAFLKELKSKDILDERKLRIVLNKAVKIRGIKDEVIIGGMAFYNDPAMSFMTELFDRDRIKYVSIPFEEETYVRYLEGVIECEISLKGYSKMFIQTLRELGNMIYPIVTSSGRNSNQTYQPPSARNNGDNFSSSMNSTLDRMRGY